MSSGVQTAIHCPKCGIKFSAPVTGQVFANLGQHSWAVEWRFCPECETIVVHLAGPGNPTGPMPGGKVHGHTIGYESPRRLVFPRDTGRPAAPPELTDQAVVQDYTEACLVLADSPKASAALSRRCLQHILNTVGGATAKNLSPAIDEALAKGGIPSYVSGQLHALRNIGNFAAHPMKDQTGQIVDVEPGEAEWNLDVLESMFDFYYVEPARIQSRKAALNAKLASAGKPQIP